MKIKKISIDNPSPTYYLTDILNDNGYNGLIPSNCILNKRRPSIGATHCELFAKRHSIIIEPYVTVIEVKKKKMDEEGEMICAVMKRSFELKTLVDYLTNDNVEFKKVLTTPESFGKVIRALKKIDANYRDNYFLLIDECDKLVQEALFRNRIFAPIEEFFKFENKAMVSATPPIFSHPSFEAAGFTVIDLIPTFDYKKNIKLVATNNIRASLRNIVKQLKLKKDGKPVFLFTNCKRTILYFTKLEDVKDNFKVFCAEELGERFFKLNNVENIYNSVADQDYAQYNALTSRFFSAVDIHPHDFAHVIIVTNVPYVAHSMIDPSTEAVQICGRDRLQAKEMKQMATITHITNLFPKEISGKAVTIETEQYYIERLQHLSDNATSPVAKAFIETAIDKEQLAMVLKSDGQVEPFLKDNYNFDKNTRSLYFDSALLKKEYNDCKCFQAELVVVNHPFSDKDDLELKTAKGGVGGNKLYIAKVEKLLTAYDPFANNENEFFDTFLELADRNKLLFNAYRELGYDGIKDLGFAKTRIKQAIFDLKKSEGNNAFLMIDKIVVSFKLNIKIYADDLKEQLQAIYDEFNYEKSEGNIHHAKGTDILKYFNGKYYTGKVKDDSYRGYFRLFAPVDKLSNYLSYMNR